MICAVMLTINKATFKFKIGRWPRRTAINKAERHAIKIGWALSIFSEKVTKGSLSLRGVTRAEPINIGDWRRERS